MDLRRQTRRVGQRVKLVDCMFMMALLLLLKAMVRMIMVMMMLMVMMMILVYMLAARTAAMCKPS